MSGHSKWSTIKREKGAKDAKRGAVFTKIGNQIAIAARSGIDPNMNSVLAMSIEKAKAAKNTSGEKDKNRPKEQEKVDDNKDREIEKEKVSAGVCGQSREKYPQAVIQ